jgi:hypothetical protein
MLEKNWTASRSARASGAVAASAAASDRMVRKRRVIELSTYKSTGCGGRKFRLERKMCGRNWDLEPVLGVNPQSETF